MPFCSAIAELDTTRKADHLDHERDPAYWIVVPCKAQGWAIHFAIVRPDSSSFSKIIGALTNSLVSHAEWESTDFTPAEMVARAESKLGLPYDFEEILRKAINPNDTHHTPGREICSGVVYEIIGPELPGLQPYPTPGLLLTQSSGMLNVPMPKLALPPVEITQADIDWLDALHEERDADGRRKIAMGTLQEVKEVLGA